MSAELLARLIEAGTPPALVADVALALARADAAQEAIESRRLHERERKAKSRRVTGGHVTGRDSRDAGSPYEDTSTPSGTDLSDEASASSPLRQPISEARDFWNETAEAVGWSPIRTLSPQRSKLLAARLRQHGLDGWKAAVNRARASPYLAGADPPSWFTFPWLIKAENFLKTIEGNYDRNRSQPASGWQAAFVANAGPG